MASKEVAVVFGVNGRLGGSVARGLSKSGDFLVRAVAHGKESEQVVDLSNDRVEYINLDLSNSNELLEVLRDASVCFVSTETVMDDPRCLENEIAEGHLIADACKSANVKHLIFNSKLHSYDICGLMARHLVAKAEVEKYMRDINLPLTCLILPVFYEEVCELFVSRAADSQRYDIDIPMGSTSLDMISVEDIAQIVLTVLRRRDVYLYKTLSVCGDKLTVKEMALVLSKYLRPKVFKDKQLTCQEFHHRRSHDLRGSADWANSFEFLKRVDQRYNISVAKVINHDLHSYEDWVKDNVSKLNSVLQ